MHGVSGAGDSAFVDTSIGGVDEAIRSQLATAGLVRSATARGPVTEREFFTNEEFWLNLLNERLRGRAVVHLRRFALLEWFPRSPGLFHTQYAKWSRDAAGASVLDPMRYGLPALPPHDDLRVYSVFGKMSMIAGGFGCLRLRDKLTADGRFWFMSASATSVAHEGVPVGLPEQIYERVIEDIAEHGAVVGDLTGRLTFVPDVLEPAYHGYNHVPMLYLQVERFRPMYGRSDDDDLMPAPLACAAVTFRTEPASRLYTEFPEFPAAFVEFTPGAQGNLRDRLEWLERYVREFCDGTIVTDFDEHMSRFDDAVFSLHKVSTGSLDPARIGEVLETERWRIGAITVNQLILQQGTISLERASIGELTMGDNFSNIGDGVTIINRSLLSNALNQVSSTIGEDTAAALRTLADHVQRSGNADAAEHFEAFLEEVEREQPRRARLSAFWDGLVKALPSVAQLGEVTAKVIEILSRF